MATSRDTFPLRFKRPHTREALKHLAAAQGMSMTDVAERAIEHEVTLLGLDVERRLQEALEVVRGYTASDSADTEDYLSAIEAGERSGLEPMRDVVGGAAAQRASVTEPLDDPYGVLAAFSIR